MALNCSSDQEEWMLMQQRQRKSRSQSLPQSVLGLQLGQRGSKILHPAGSMKVASYINKIPQFIQLQNQNPPCVKLDYNETVFESPSPERKRKNKKEEDDSQISGVTTHQDEDLLSIQKGLEMRPSNMSTLQIPNSGKIQVFSNKIICLLISLCLVVTTCRISFLFYRQYNNNLPSDSYKTTFYVSINNLQNNTKLHKITSILFYFYSPSTSKKLFSTIY